MLSFYSVLGLVCYHTLVDGSSLNLRIVILQYFAADASLRTCPNPPTVAN